ncbi:MAG: RecX family transcriptional regulator [Elusimicrobiota bacterium]|jgi:regulatory protein|nr:RecX family transcriptional regulator [Elusimicrobiota bacterium]
MKISNIKKGKSVNNIFEIIFENGDSIDICADTIVKFSLKEGLDISEKDYKSILSFDMSNKISKEAFSLISKQFLSSKSLTDKLAKKGYESEDIQETVEKLKKSGYIDDKKFALSYADHLISKKKGALFISSALEKHLIDKTIIAEIVNSLKENDTPEKQIIEILNTKYKKLNTKDDKAVLKAANFFVQRGFLYEDIEKAFRKFANIDISNNFAEF